MSRETHTAGPWFIDFDSQTSMKGSPKSERFVKIAANVGTGKYEKKGAEFIEILGKLNIGCTFGESFTLDNGEQKPCSAYMPSFEEARANARLIAAAPDMLEALRALRLAREQDKCPNWERGVPEFSKAEALADAAIAKASQP